MGAGAHERESPPVQTPDEGGTADRATSKTRLADRHGESDFEASGIEYRDMNYPIVLHKDKGSDFGVTVPDLPGCFSAGRAVDEALAMAKEAIELHLEGLIKEGLPIPQPASIEQHQRNREYRGGTWAVVSIEESSLRVRAKRINITIPERVLDAVDRYASEHGQTRSGLLAAAAATYIGRETDRALPKAKRGRPRKRESQAE